MDDEAITNHKKMAMDGLGSVESPFKSGIKQDAPSRGELKDSQRSAGKTGDEYDK